MAMLPHERSLVKRLAEKPFVLLGVNGDRKETFLESLKEKPIPFRSWVDDDGDAIRGPVARAWNVADWPTLYLLDVRGVIRRKWLGAPPETELDAAIASLLDEIETEE